jgi:hypothetical protein
MSRIFGVLTGMNEKIMHYLVLQILADPSFDHDVGRRMKCAWILAQKKYQKLDQNELQEILHRLEAKGDDYLEQGNWD